MEAKEFINVFGEITKIAGEKPSKNVSNDAEHSLSIICHSLDAMSEFGGVSDSRAVYLMKCIRDKFDANDEVGKEVLRFIENVSTLLVDSNRFVWDYGKISTAIKKLEKECI